MAVQPLQSTPSPPPPNLQQVELFVPKLLLLNFLRSTIVFLRKLVRQRRTDVTSFCMQFEKIGRGLLWEAIYLCVT